MNVEEMKKRATESARVASDLKADDDDDGLEVGDVLKDRRGYAFAAGALAADVLTLLAERERIDALLAALRSVDERELPEHVAAALRALDTPATQPATDPHVSSR